MQSPTNNVKEIELFGMKLLLAERTARDVNALQKQFEASKDNVDALLQSAVIVRDGLKINLKPFINNPPRWYELKRKKEYKKLSSAVNIEQILTLPIRIIGELSIEVLRLEGIDVDSFKKKVIPDVKKEGLAVTLQTDSLPISST